MTREATIRHEAGHAAMAGCLGIEVNHVSVIPDRRSWGHVRLVRSTPAHSIVTLLAGCIEDAAIPAWPIDHPRTQDEQDIRDLIDGYDIDRSQYAELTICALRLAATRRYSRLHCALTSIFDYTPVVHRDLLERVVATTED